MALSSRNGPEGGSGRTPCQKSRQCWMFSSGCACIRWPWQGVLTSAQRLRP